MLVVADGGYAFLVPFVEEAERSVLFELISERYERKSIAITANQPFSASEEVADREARMDHRS